MYNAFSYKLTYLDDVDIQLLMSVYWLLRYAENKVKTSIYF